MNIEASVIILSGGKNSRMNYKNKAFLLIDNERFIEKIIKRVGKFKEIVISCDECDKYKEFEDSCRLVEDKIKGIGPIGGIYSSLKTIKNDRALIVASDMPLISEYLITSLIGIDFNGEALVPVFNGKEEPLCAIYKKSIVEKIFNNINKQDYKLKSLIKNLDVTYILISDERALTNINTPEEYKKLINKKTRVINVVSSCSNIGKTTVIEGIIKELKIKGYSITTIKHDVHGFDIDKKGKDTWRHRKAGAETVCISSENKFAMIKEVKVELELDEIIRKNSESDFIIVEGYKNSPYRKIEVVRREISEKVITPKEKLIAVASNFQGDIQGIEWVDINDYKKLVELIEMEKFID